MEPLLLGLDIGTSSCKAALFHTDGTVAASETAAYHTLYPRPGWAEQNPQQWWEALCGALRKLMERSGTDPARIAGIGATGQSWSAIPVSKDGAVLCGTPIWMDTRAAAECEALRQRIGEQAIFDCSGNPLQPSYTLPKILWYKKHLPEVYENADKILQSNSFITYRLTGEMTQDLSQGYGLQCFDIRKGQWNTALCREMGIRESLLPDVVPCHRIIGTVTKEAALQTGLLPGIPVVAGGLDAACGTLGAGVIRDGETQEQGGQAGGMSICMERCHADPRLILSHHVVPGRWLLQGGTVGGGGVMRWFETELGEAERQTAAGNGGSSLKEIDRLAQRVPPGSEGLVFLPYMAGERSPIWNPAAKGVYYGLDFSKTRGHMARAAMEGVAYSLRHNLAAAREAGAKVNRLRAMGGAAGSRLWTQIKSDVTGLPIDVPVSGTATTLGAAILAGVAAGVYRDFPEAVARTVRVQRSHEPDQGLKACYDEGYETYLQLYEQLRPLMR